jgi:hypothetical protein
MDLGFRLSAIAYDVQRAILRSPIHFAILAVAAVMCLSSLGVMLAAEKEFELVRRDAINLANAGPRPRQVSPERRHPSLSAFRSTALVRSLHEAGDISALTLDQIDLTFEDTPSQPFIRYRASFSGTSSYAGIRKFIAAMLAGSRDVALDAVSCDRADLKSTGVSCDFTFSAVYRKDGRG